jgi:hypothetical protein
MIWRLRCSVRLRKTDRELSTSNGAWACAQVLAAPAPTQQLLCAGRCALAGDALRLSLRPRPSPLKQTNHERIIR